MRRFSPAILALMFVLLLSGLASAQITLVPGPQTLVSRSPKFIAAADFNNDGFEDAVVTNSASDRVTVLFGQDGQSFNPVVDVIAGRTPRGLVTGDLNNDGIPDIAFADLISRSVFLVPGAGGLHFGQPQSFKVSAEPLDVTIGQFDAGNGNDLAAAALFRNAVEVLVNIGANHGFRLLGEFKVGRTPKRLEAKDLNGDGFTDIVTINTGTSAADDISVLLNTGVGSFRRPTDFVVGPGAKDLVIADFNNDGVPDIAVLNAALTSQQNVFSISILINRTENANGRIIGTGDFDILNPVTVSCPLMLGGIPIQCNPNFMAAGDFDNDTFIDLAVSLNTVALNGNATHVQTAGLLAAYAGHGDGSFDLATQVNVAVNPQGIVAADFNGDGVTDLAVAEQFTRTVRIINALLPPPRATGQTCTVGRQCLSGSCVDGTCCGSPSCPAGQFCDIPANLGVCTSPEPNGGMCTDGHQCQSGFCVDGFCCGSRVCPAGQFCNSGQCAPPAPNGVPCNAEEQCASTFCVDGVCCSSDRCAANQACNIPGSEGACTATLPIGSPCTSPAQCTSTFCVNGFCCEAACTASQSCAVAGREGLCTDLPTPTPTPSRTATPTITPTPAPTGVMCADGSNCISGFCVDGICCGTASCPSSGCSDDGQHCNISGHFGMCACRLPIGSVCQNDTDCATQNCQAGSPKTCQAAKTPTPTLTPTPLGGGAPCTNNNQCQAGLVCSTDEHVCCGTSTCPAGQSCRVTGHGGSCFTLPTPTPTLIPLGNPCDAAHPERCESDFCTDGVCCDTDACENAGDRCDIFGFEGTCAPPLGAGDKNTDCDVGLLCLADATSNSGARCHVPFTATPTLHVPEEPTSTPGFIINQHRSGGCSLAERPDAAGVWLLAALPVGLWLRRQRVAQRIRDSRNERG